MPIGIVIFKNPPLAGPSVSLELATLRLVQLIGIFMSGVDMIDLSFRFMSGISLGEVYLEEINSLKKNIPFLTYVVR